MDKIKFLKKFILILLVIIINTSSLDVFATPPSEDDSVYENKSTILDGEIGEWDPTLNDNPNFNDVELEDGVRLPQENEYYTISVTVPVNMEFYVFQHSNKLEGNLFSPIYSIKNNGSKNISVKINSFYRKENTEIYDKNTVPLYVEKLNSEDGRTQIELKMCAIEDLGTSMRVSKEIDLTEFKPDVNLEKELYTLSANQKKGVTFEAEKWEFPNVSEKGKAISNFSAGFVFSVVE